MVTVYSENHYNDNCFQCDLTRFYVEDCRSMTSDQLRNETERISCEILDAIVRFTYGRRGSRMDLIDSLLTTANDEWAKTRADQFA